jgi:hypothetical protein
MSVKKCKCLKDLDMTGVPVTLNWQGENSHGTRAGGFVTVIGLLMVGTFILGSFLTYIKFQQVNQQNLENFIDVPHNIDCSAEDN